MICEGCGFESPALKTVRWRNGERRFALCDGCWGPISFALWVVAGDFTVTSKCERCQRFLNPRELVEARPGGHGKRDLVSTGTCVDCSGRGFRT